MEKQRPQKEDEKPREVPAEKDKELKELQEELLRLRQLKKERELQELEKQKKKESSQVSNDIQDSLPSESYLKEEPVELEIEDEIEARFAKIDDFLTSNLGTIDEKAYKQHATQIESELQKLEKEIVGETGLIEKELSPYEKLLESYPWLEEKRYEFMYSIPSKKQNLNDYLSWRREWSKVFFDYARYAILHVIYVKQIAAEKPFAKFEDRANCIREIAEELVSQGLATFLTKKKEQLRIYWKSLDNWANEIYNWAYDLGRLDPIMLFEIRGAQLEFSTLPKEDLEEIFKILAKSKRAKIIKLEEGQLAFRIKLE
ncbi:MAG: hypothetical protein JW891_03150 [Candidatus Lokiarchaeota archaeon]|nr:hypothetical protein [Candidatus Lokiarchaeota archaeon]